VDLVGASGATNAIALGNLGVFLPGRSARSPVVSLERLVPSRSSRRGEGGRDRRVPVVGKPTRDANG
jgi:hypothetical protein